MSVPINVEKIKTGSDITRFQFIIEEGSRSNWNKTYNAKLKDFLHFRERINIIFEELTLAERLEVSSDKGLKIEEFYSKEKFCNTCDYKESKDCIDCIFELQSPLERKLFIELKKNGIYFDIQRGIDYNGKHIYTKDKAYDDPENNFKNVLTIPDFYIGKYDLCIYTDGHTYHERTEEQASRDRKIDRKLQELGFKVLRYTGKDINENIEKVIKEIQNWIEKSKKTRINK